MYSKRQVLFKVICYYSNVKLALDWSFCTVLLTSIAYWFCSRSRDDQNSWSRHAPQNSEVLQNWKWMVPSFLNARRNLVIFATCTYPLPWWLFSPFTLCYWMLPSEWPLFLSLNFFTLRISSFVAAASKRIQVLNKVYIGTSLGDCFLIVSYKFLNFSCKSISKTATGFQEVYIVQLDIVLLRVLNLSTKESLLIICMCHQR